MAGMDFIDIDVLGEVGPTGVVGPSTQLRILFGLEKTVDDLRAYITTIPPEAQQFFSAANPKKEVHGDSLVAQYKATGGLIVKKFKPIEPLTIAAHIQPRLPHFGAPALEKILAQLKEIAVNQLDRDSIREKVSDIDMSAVEAAKKELTIINHTDYVVNQPIFFDGEEFMPVAVLPRRGGVELRSRYSYQYRCASAADVALAEARKADIASCKKQLEELPRELKASQDALEEHMKGGNPDFNLIGKVNVEQYKLKTAIEAERKKLDDLLALPSLEADADSFVLHTRQTVVTLKFGTNKLGKKIYHVMEAIQTEHANEAVATSTDEVEEKKEEQKQAE